MDIFWKRFSATQNFPSEQRVIFFADDVNTKNSLHSSISTPKTPKNLNAATAKIFDSERKKATQALNNLLQKDRNRQDPTETLQKIQEIQKKTVGGTAVLNDALGDLSDKDRATIQTILEHSKTEKKQKTDTIVSDLRSQETKKFSKEHLNILATHSISSVLENIGNDIDRKNFFTALENLDTSKMTDEKRALLKSLQKELKFLLESDEMRLTRKEKKILFEQCVFLRCTKEKKENFAEMAKKIAEEFHIEDAFIHDEFLKNWFEKMFSVRSLEDGLELMMKDQNLSEKETEMFESVKATLGVEAAEKAKKAMTEYDRSDQISRLRAFLDSVQSTLPEKIGMLEKAGLKATTEMVRQTENLLASCIDVFPGLADREKDEKKNHLNNGFLAFYGYIEALEEVQKTKSNEPLLKFLHESERQTRGEKEVKEQYFRFMSPAEVQLALEIEAKRGGFQQELLAMRGMYADECATLKKNPAYVKMMEDEKSFSTQEILQNPSLSALTENGSCELFLQKKEFRPYHFASMAAFQKKYGILNREIVEMFANPLENKLPENVLKILSEKQQIPKSVKIFFGASPIESGIAKVMNTLNRVQGSIFEHASSAGWFEKGEEAKAKENFEKITTQELEENRRRIYREKIFGMAEKIRSFPNISGKNQKLFANAVQFLEGKANAIQIPLDADAFLREVSGFQRNMGELLQKNGGDFVPLSQGIDQNLNAIMGALESLENSLDAACRSESELAFFLRGLKIADAPLLSEEKIFVNQLGNTFEKFLNHQPLSGTELLRIINPQTNAPLVQKMDWRAEGKLIADGAKPQEIFAFDKNTDTIFVGEKMYENLQDLKDGNIFAGGKDFELLAASLLHEKIHLICKYNTNALQNFDDFLAQFYAENGENLKDWVEEELQNATTNGYATTKEELLANLGMGVCSNAKVQDLCVKIIDQMGSRDQLNQFLKEQFAGFSAFYLKENDQEYLQSNLAFATGLDLGEDEETENASNAANAAGKQKEIRLTSDSRQKKLEKWGDLKTQILSHFRQIQDAKDVFEGSEKKKINDWDNYISSELSTTHAMLSSSAQTENDAEAILTHLNDKILNNLKKMIGQISSENMDSPSYLANVWKDTRFLSMNDLKTMFSTTVEYIKRRYDTKSKRRIGEVGHNLFNGILPGLAGEFDRQAQNAEKSEVGDIQEPLGNKSDQQVLDFLKEVNNVDAFKAIMQELSGRGLIRWEGDSFAGKRIYEKKLKELGATVRFYEEDYDPKKSALLNAKFQRAFLQVYGDESMFNGIYNTNKGKIDSRISDGKDVANQRGGIEDQLNEWLKMGGKGEYVPSHEFEGYVHFMVGDGTTEPSYYMYYLLMGVKEGIITPDALSRFYKMSNEFPPGDEIRKWSYDQIIRATEQILPEGHNSWEGVPASYIPWVHANIMTSGSTVERTLINLGQGKLQFDHDNAHLLASIGDASTAVRFLSEGSTGNTQFKETMYNQAVLGIMQNITSLGLYNETGQLDKKNMLETIRRQAGYFAAFDGLGSRRVGSKKSKYNFNDDFLRKHPRAGGSYNDNLNTGDYLNMGREIFSSVQNPAFKRICQEWMFQKNLNGDAEKSQKDWDEKWSKDPAVIEAFSAADISVMLFSKNKEEPDKTYTTIINRLFTYYLSESDDAEANVESILSAAKNVANGKGIQGVPDSQKWEYAALQPENKGESKIPARFASNWKN